MAGRSQRHLFSPTRVACDTAPDYDDDSEEERRSVAEAERHGRCFGGVTASTTIYLLIGHVAKLSRGRCGNI